MPFGAHCEYANFDACVVANSDKADPQAYCAALMRETEDHCKMATADQRQHFSKIGLREGDCVVFKQFDAVAEPMEDRRIRFTITTADPDRERDIVDASGVDMDAFMRNPVVLFAHDYKSLPVARAIQLERQADRIVATTEFATADLNPIAEQVYRMVKGGFLRGASIGFRPLEWNYDEERRGVNFHKVELLEFSIVPVPANAMALIAASAAGIDVMVLKDWAERTLDAIERAPMPDTMPPDENGKCPATHEMGDDGMCHMKAVGKGVSPRDVSTDKADEAAAWSAPVLGDFTDQPWGELGAGEKRRIAGHYAWAEAVPPATFGDLKLPHHEAAGGKVVLRGVVAAAGRLNQVDIPAGDLAAVKAHLARHYRAFDREPPWETDEVGWAAVVKAVTRTQRTQPVSDAQLASILDDYGFEVDAATLRATPAVLPVAPTSEATEPIRWNMQLSKAFDVEAEPVEPSRLVAKRGRVLSKRNEDKLRTAYGQIGEVLSSVESAPESPEEMPAEGAGIALELAVDDSDQTVLEIDECEEQPGTGDVIDVDVGELGAEIGRALRDVVQAETRAAINAARGRID